MSIKASVKMDLKFPSLIFTKELLRIADRAIIPDIQKRIDKEVNISDNVYPSLASSTIKQKLRKGLNTGILKATGKLRRSPVAGIVGENQVLITLSGIRPEGLSNRDLGDILQNQGVRTKSGKRYFEFFGISVTAEREAIREMEAIIDERIKRV